MKNKPYSETPSNFFSCNSQVEVKLTVLPKVELHVHLEGTMPPDLLRELADKYQVKLAPDLFTADGSRIAWNGFIDFLDKYDAASSVVCCQAAMTDITYAYLRDSHTQGAIYVELTVSPDHLDRFNVSYVETIKAVEEGIEKAKAEFGIEARILIVLVRHLGQEKCEQLVEKIIANPNPYVVGIGLAGNEFDFKPQLFSEAFAKARAAGLQLTAHAGEWTSDGEDILYAINQLGVTRVGHGLHAAFNEHILAVVKEKNIHLEICPNSNHCTNTKQGYPKQHKDLVHPLRIFHEQGIRYSLNSDDPPYFNSNIRTEYAYAMHELGLKASDLLTISWNAVEDSFAPDDLKQTLKEKIKQFAVMNGLVFNPVQKQTLERRMTI